MVVPHVNSSTFCPPFILLLISVTSSISNSVHFFWLTSTHTHAHTK